MRVEIAIPVLNEETTLEGNIRAVTDHFRTQALERYSLSLTIADNGSTDDTRQIGERLAHEFEQVRYLRLEQRGVGRALKAAWSNSTADIVGFMDLDLATDLKHLPEALAAIADGRGDIAYGSRLHRDSVVVGRTIRRAIVSRAFNWILRFYLNVTFSDGMCGFKFLRRDALERLAAAGAVSDGWFFSTELLVAGQKIGFRLIEIPVHWTDDPDSRVNIRKLAVEYLRAMKRIKHHGPS